MMSQWQTALHLGTGEFLISLALCAAAYFCLTLCISELAGIIAFSGGSYGYSRCALSPFIGYIVGICDLLQSVMFSAICINKISEAISMLVSGNDYLTYLPCWWIATYTLILLIALPGGRCFWNSMSGFTIMTIVMLLIYTIGNAPRFDFAHHAHQDIPMFAGSSWDFMKELITPAICFVGVDFITLFSDEAKDPQRDIPRGMTGAICFTIIMVFWVILTAVSMDPGVGPEMTSEKIVFVTHMGFENLFHIENSIANFLIAPTLFSAAAGYLFAAGRQMNSMSKSGLLPQCLSITYNSNKVPITAMFTTAVLGLITLFPVWIFNPQADDVYELAMIGACVVYLSLFWCFLLFKVHYGSMDRTFVNPLGSASAIFGILYFSVVIISLLFVQLDFNSLIAFVPFMLLAVVYYYRVVESRQFFSKEEQQKFMKAYILNANRRKKKGLSPFMKKMRQLYNEYGLDKVFGPWNIVTGQSIVGSASSSNKSGTSNKSGRSDTATQKSTRSSQHAGSGKSIVSAFSSVSSSAGVSKVSVRVQSLASSSTDAPNSSALVPFPAGSVSLDLESTQTTIQMVHEHDVAVTPTSGPRNAHKIVPMTDTQLVSELLKVKAMVDPRIAAIQAASAEDKVDDPVVLMPIDESGNGICWSGKLMTEEESRKFFEIINSNSRISLHSHPEEDLVAQLPNQFIITGNGPNAQLFHDPGMTIHSGDDFGNKDNSLRDVEMTSFSAHVAVDTC